ncbi:hypothetical protein [Lentilactobacillus hilgardii]|uniref:hypothetical protein n=1 Tax=Lentilactobacillus hilgardii TaxID=1588 RepID=UPI0039EBB572
MTLPDIVQTIAVAASLFIAVTGWIINWRQRVNDKKPEIVATVMNNFLHKNPDSSEMYYVVQLRNIGNSTAILEEFRISKIHSDGRMETITENGKHLNLPMFPTQLVNSTIQLNTGDQYHVCVAYTEVNKSKIQVFETVLSSKMFKNIEPHGLMNMQ